jgi:hypothetical protein
MDPRLLEVGLDQAEGWSVAQLVGRMFLQPASVVWSCTDWGGWDPAGWMESLFAASQDWEGGMESLGLKLPSCSIPCRYYSGVDSLLVGVIQGWIAYW